MNANQTIDPMLIRTILQLLGLIFVYALMTLFFPALVYGKRWKKYNFSFRFLMYFTTGNFFIINIVLLLGVFKLLYPPLVFGLTIGITFMGWIIVNRMDLAILSSEFVLNLRRFAEGTIGTKTAFYNMCGIIKRKIIDTFKWIWENICKNWADSLFVFAIVLTLIYVYGTNILNYYGFMATDTVVHAYWITYLEGNVMYAGGVYPFGYHAMVYFLHILSGMDTYVVLRLISFVNVLFIHLGLLAMLRSILKSRFLSYGIIILFILTTIFNVSTYSRFFAALPNEFSMMYIGPAICFLVCYMREKAGIRLKWKKNVQENILTKALEFDQDNPIPEVDIIKEHSLPELVQEAIEDRLIDNEILKEHILVKDFEHPDIETARMEIEEEEAAMALEQQEEAEDTEKERKSIKKLIENIVKSEKFKRVLKLKPIFEFFEKLETEESARMVKMFAMAVACSFATHFYTTMVIIIVSAAITFAYSVFATKFMGFVKVTFSGLMGILMGALPMLLALIAGNQIQGSIIWGLRIITNTSIMEQAGAVLEDDYKYDLIQQEEVAKILAKADADYKNKTEKEKIQFIVREADSKGVLLSAEPKDVTNNEQQNQQASSTQTTDKDTPINIIVNKTSSIWKRVIYNFQRGWDVSKNAIQMFAFNKNSHQYEITFFYSTMLLLTLMIGFLYMFRDRIYGTTIFSVGLAMLIMYITPNAPFYSLPMLFEMSRAYEYMVLLLPLAVGIFVDSILCLPEMIIRVKSEKIGKLVTNILSIAVSLYAVLYLYSVPGSFKQPPDPEKEELPAMQECNENILCLTNIIDTEPDYTWTVVSANDERGMVYGHGFHYETGGLLWNVNNYTKNSTAYIPTETVFFFVEKRPINYNVTYEDSGQMISPKGAMYPLSAMQGNEMYMGKDRWITMSHMYYYCESLKKLYPNEVEVYFETGNFICYKMKQNPQRLYNLSIDYGYNTKGFGNYEKEKTL